MQNEILTEVPILNRFYNEYAKRCTARVCVLFTKLMVRYIHLLYRCKTRQMLTDDTMWERLLTEMVLAKVASLENATRMELEHELAYTYNRIQTIIKDHPNLKEIYDQYIDMGIAGATQFIREFARHHNEGRYRDFAFQMIMNQYLDRMSEDAELDKGANE